VARSRAGTRYERWAAALLRGIPSAPFILADLREEHAAMRARWGGAPLLADVWYLVEAGSIAARVHLEHHRGRRVRRRTAPPPTSLDPGEPMRTELRYAIRFLRRQPAFSGAIIVTVALAIAATTLVFAVVNGVLISPLRYAHAERLVAVWERQVARQRDRNVVSPANFLAWREQLSSFDALASLVEVSTTVLGHGEPERVGAVQASAAYFDIVGARPLVGRLYDEHDDADGAEPVVVLAEGYWRRRFGADPGVIGQPLNLAGASRTVVGVLPERSDFHPEAAFGAIGTRDVWVPPQFGADARQASGRYLEVLGRLASGATADQAQQEASLLAARFAQTFPDRQAGWDINVVPLKQDLVGDVRSTLLIVFGAVCLVLLIACANVANLLMTRATERQQEMAVRSAMGAQPRRLLRQLLLESLVLSLVGGAAGVLGAYAGVHWLASAAPNIPRLNEIDLDPRVAGFALLATLATALLFGLAPAIHVVRTDLVASLKERSTIGRRGARRLRGALAIAQIALSLELLIGAGLLTRSLANRIAVGVGFDPSNLLTATVQLPGRRYNEAAQAQFFEQLVDRVSAMPGVRAASAVVFAPLSGAGSATSFWPLDRPVPQAGQLPVADIRWVQQNFHRTLGIPLVAGRFFDQTDRAGQPLHVLINRTGAEQLWPDESAIGKRIAMPWNDTLVAEVVGVVGDVRYAGPDVAPRAMLYWDHRQTRPFNEMTLVIRTAGPPLGLVPTVRTAVHEMDPELPLYNVRSMTDLFSDALARARFTTVSLGAFALLALLLAAVGIYGVVAYSTRQRQREIGIRIALGADGHSVTGMVVRQSMAMVAIALILGALGAIGLSRVLRSLVFDVSTTDPLTFATMATLLGLTGLVACWLPARRAARIDPLEAIRVE
jgi:putative ABC transport system permease protein